MSFITDLFVPKQPSLPPMPVMQQKEPDADDKGAKEAVDRMRRAMMSAKGRASTLLTGGMGLTTPPPVNLKTALGE